MEEQQAISNEALMKAANWEKCVLKIAVEMYAKKQGIPRSQKAANNELFDDGLMQSKPISMEINADNARDNGHFPTPPYYTASVSPLTGQMQEKIGAKSVADPIGIAQMMHSFELAKNPYGVGDISTRPMFDLNSRIATQRPNINSSFGPETTPEIHTENGHKGVIKSMNSKIGIADQKQHSLSTTTSLLHNVQKQLQLKQHSSLNFLNGGEAPKSTIASSNQTTADWLNNQLLSLLAAKKAAEEQEQQQQQRRQLEKLLFSAGQQLALNRKPFSQSPSAENNQIRIDAKSAFSPVHHNQNFHEDKPHRLLRGAVDFTASTMRSSEPPMQRIFDAGIKLMSTEEALLVAKILLENNR